MALYRKHFGGIPVWEMIKRGWISVAIEPTSNSETEALLDLVKRQLIAFFRLESEAELDDFIAGKFDPLSQLFYTPEPRSKGR
jgi:hypothetical protein